MHFEGKKPTGKRVDLHPAHIMKMVRRGEFPAPVKIGKRVLFVVGEVEDWMRARAADRDAAERRVDSDEEDGEGEEAA